jgi:hypothetical protein
MDDRAAVHRRLNCVKRDYTTAAAYRSAIAASEIGS